jgi:serine/threonine protein kinase
MGVHGLRRHLGEYGYVKKALHLPSKRECSLKIILKRKFDEKTIESKLAQLKQIQNLVRLLGNQGIIFFLF